MVMRRILPRLSAVLEDDFCASHGKRVGCSSVGVKPSLLKGLVLSPIASWPGEQAGAQRNGTMQEISGQLLQH